MLTFRICVLFLASYANAYEGVNTVGSTPEPTTSSPPLDYSDYMFAIYKKGIPVCAGSVVEATSKRIMIVTAARCVFRTQASTLTVSPWKKSTSAEFALDQMAVDQVIEHPYYMPPSLDYEIALLKIRTNQDQRIKEFTLKKSELNLNESIQIVNLDLRTKGELEVSSASVEGRKSCQTKLGEYPKLSSKMLCATFQSGVPVSDGSPLVLEEEIVAVGFYELNVEFEPDAPFLNSAWAVSNCIQKLQKVCNPWVLDDQSEVVRNTRPIPNFEPL